MNMYSDLNRHVMNLPIILCHHPSKHTKQMVHVSLAVSKYCDCLICKTFLSDSFNFTTMFKPLKVTLYAVKPERKLVTTLFNCASVCSVILPSLAMVCSKVCWEARRCFKNSASKVVILDGSTLSR